MNTFITFIKFIMKTQYLIILICLSLNIVKIVYYFVCC